MLPKRQPTAPDEFARLSDAEIKGVVDETNILGNADSRIPYDIVSGPRGPLKERLLNIESRKIQDFMETDVEEVLRAQVRTMSADVEISKKLALSISPRKSARSTTRPTPRSPRQRSRRSAVGWMQPARTRCAT